jgi:hypothetical protein
MGPPAACSVCRGAFHLLWVHGRPAGPCWPTAGTPACWYHDVERQLANGGLPRASGPLGNLEGLLAAWDKREAREAERLRGIRYSVSLGGTVHELLV